MVWIMELLKGRVIRLAAEEAYQNELTNITDEEKEYPDKRDWVQNKIDGWFTKAAQQYEKARDEDGVVRKW